MLITWLHGNIRRCSQSWQWTLALHAKWATSNQGVRAYLSPSSLISHHTKSNQSSNSRSARSRQVFEFGSLAPHMSILAILFGSFKNGNSSISQAIQTLSVIVCNLMLKVLTLKAYLCFGASPVIVNTMGKKFLQYSRGVNCNVKSQNSSFTTILYILSCIPLPYMFLFAKYLPFPKMLLETEGIFHVKQSRVCWVGKFWCGNLEKLTNLVQFELTLFFNCLAWHLNWKASYLKALSPPLQLDPYALLGKL